MSIIIVPMFQALAFLLEAVSVLALGDIFHAYSLGLRAYFLLYFTEDARKTFRIGTYDHFLASYPSSCSIA